MNKQPFKSGDAVRHVLHRGQIIFEGYGPNSGEGSILVGPLGNRQRFIVPLDELQPAKGETKRGRAAK